MRVLYIAPALPVLTCTFIYREIFDLRAMGVEVDTVSMNKPAADKVSPEAAGLLETTCYLDEMSEFRKFYSFFRMLLTRPVRTMRCLRLFLGASPMQGARDYVRLGYHLVEACFLVKQVEESRPEHIHCHFITGAASIGMFLSALTGIPYSFTMHASAIWIDPIALRAKLRTCRFCVSISEFNKRHVSETYGSEYARKINIVHCGIDLSEIRPHDTPVEGETGQISILAIGQLMKRKGYHVLIPAAKMLKDAGVMATWTVVGDGPERARLERMIREYDVEDTVLLVGAKPHDEITQFLRNADIFALPCVIGDDNTRDGIPVALMEAMATGLPVVSTSIVGLPELIDSGENGVLVEPDDPRQLADAILDLAESPELRRRLGTAAIEKVDREFNSRRSAEQLQTLFSGSVRDATHDALQSSVAK